ncbi:MAG: M20/M25/M40 family metallo-hydrolase [Christensenellaceae bacterium]|nr:M20/M25/M40 family metallo-hydrolase [Christensenellaceae bacterium]
MKENHDYKAGAEFVKNFAGDVIQKFGPRLPGSDEERAAAADIANTFSTVTGNDTKVEDFKLAPIASIGFIPVLGVVSLLSLGLYILVSPWASFALSTVLLLYAVVQIFMYKGLFDVLFPQKISKNLYSKIDGGSKIDYTIVYSGHIDSSWNWNLAVTKHPQLSIIKTIFGVVGILIVLLLSIIRVSTDHLAFSIKEGLVTAGDWIFFLLPFVFLPGFYWLSIYLSYDKKIASPGAMDNLSGTGLALLMAKHYKDNPDELPENCRIIVAGMGSEEAGLKGSFAFMKAHKNDTDLLVNPYFVNLDSFRDYDHFNVVTGDLWLMSHFDPELIEMGEESIKEVGLTPKRIKNPVGGCDSTPFYRAGYKTVTLCAQNPTATNYYHTYNDKVEDLNLDTLEKAYEVVLNVSNKIHAKHSSKADH